ncbi:unnamed protein product [Rotaria sordida]|uniref:G-protein coupled receptors family 1 profile domain-containing protein n=1 Tax=Rotaria sordida TaxID=392033 RepID=A0A814UWI5_9BILA|nr:unnamed protein product [Rotaria sordida]CAF1436650.1 unnamed protein product [Rotaria sordida]
MVDFEAIFSLLRIILFAILTLVTFIYSIPIIFIRRFHRRNMILTLNICSVTICCSLYWTIFYIILEFNPLIIYKFMLDSCRFVLIFSTLITLQVPFSFVTASINRFCSVVYFNKNLFKTKQWVFICILFQWIFGIIITLPVVLGIQPYCVTSQWVEIYRLIFIVIVPSIVFLIINILIYVTVRSLSHRIRPSSFSVTENNPRNIRQERISRRDIHLFRHMIIMFLIFVGGWTPLYALFAIQTQALANIILSECFTIWCQLAFLCDIIDLYLYNHEVRNYLKIIFCR